jgi:protein-tyrosine phosphatase
LEEFRQRLRDAAIPLAVLPGCDVPLSLEAMDLLEAGQVLTLNDGQRYLLLELPDTALPPALESICFRLQTKGLTPIITHPERHMLFQEMPEKLGRLLDLGCLAQLTAGSLLGNFGRRVAKISRKLVKQGYIHILASDAHNNRSRPPELSQAVQEMARLVGQDAALAMVTATPERIIQGQPFN